MQTLFDGLIDVSCSQAYLVDGEGLDTSDLAACFAGQTNGLCGAGRPGGLWLITGLHTGRVPVVVERHDTSPPVSDEWEEVVEVSFVPSAPPVALVGWAGSCTQTLDLEPGRYRVRYCIAGMDAGRAADTRTDPEPVLDRYLLQVWPAPPAPDAVVRQTGPHAAYWHGFARDLPPPPSPAERAASLRSAAEQYLEREQSRSEEAEIVRDWAGVAPSDRLRTLAGDVRGVARTDRELLAAFEALDDDVQRAVACWLARRAFEVAGIDGLDWAASTLTAADRGEPLPLTVDEAFALARADLDGPVTAAAGPGDRPLPGRRIHRPSFAVPAVFSAVEDDPLRAVVDAFSHAAATFDDRRDDLVGELWDWLVHS